MKATIKMALATATLLVSGSAVAQNLKGGYFMEGSLFRHELNPAFNTQQSYVSLPILGNTAPSPICIQTFPLEMHSPA